MQPAVVSRRVNPTGDREGNDAWGLVEVGACLSRGANRVNDCSTWWGVVEVAVLGRPLAATLAAATGATTKELMERMGHTSPGVALRYQHVMADRQAALAAALDDLARDATTTAHAEPGGHVEGTTEDAAAGERGRRPR